MKLTLPFRAALFPGLILALPLRADPPGALPLTDALESGGIQWRTGSESPWFGTAMASHDGVDSGRSGGSGSGESWLEADVTGPSALSFWLNVEVPGAQVLLNETAREEPAGGWAQRRMRLGPGAQRVRFAAPYHSHNSAGTDAMFLDEVKLTPSESMAIGEAADAPGLTWTGSAGTFGYAETGEGISGGDVVVVQARGATPGEVTAHVTGPAAVRFHWKMTGYPPNAKLTVWTGNVSVVWNLPENFDDPSRGPEAWYDAEVLVPPDAQAVRWVPDAGGDFLLDAVSVTPSVVPGVAVGQPGLTWSGDWLTRPAAGAVGGSVAVTPVLAYGQQMASLMTNITGPAEVTFLSSLLRAVGLGSNQFAPYGAVPVWVDGVRGPGRTVAEADGWQRTTIFVPEGEHTVAWVVANDQNVWFHQYFQGVLDDVRITPVTPAGLAEAMKTTLAPQVTEGATLQGRWRGMKSLTSGINGSAAVCGPLEDGEATTLSLPVTGPARLLLSLRGERTTWWDDLKVTGSLDGVEVFNTNAVEGPYMSAALPPSPEWRALQIAIPSGAHTVTLRAFSHSPGPLLWLDAVGYLPADPGVSKIAGAVEMPGTLWRRTTTSGRGNWRLLSTPMAREGRTFAACMDVPARQSASLETTITGPGRVSFSWGQTENGRLSVAVDGEEAAVAWRPVAGNGLPDEREELLIPSGAHALRWTFTQAAQPWDLPAATQAWLDSVKFTPSPAASPVAAGLDVTAVVTTDSLWPWRTAVPEFSATGDGDAVTVTAPRDGTAWLEMPVTGPGRFAFWWRAESDYQSGGLVALAVDGSWTAWLPANDNWYRSEIAVGPGAHVLRWSVGSGGSGQALTEAVNAWFDGFTQLPTLPLAEALDAPALTFTSGAPSLAGDFTDWIGLPAADTAAYPGADDAAVTPGTRPLTTQVTGPGIVTFRWAEKTVPPLPAVSAPELPPSPSSPVAVSGAGLGLAMIAVGVNWEWWQQQQQPKAIFAVNGVSRATLGLTESEPDSAFITHSVHIGAGPHTLTWQRPTRSDGRRLIVERVSFAPEPDVFVPVAAELGVPLAAFTMNDTPWTVQSAQTHDGSAALQSGSSAAGSTELKLDVTGPGELSFWWKGTTGADFRNPFYDHDPNGWIIVIGPEPWLAPAGWQRFTLRIPAGQHRYSWRAAPGATLWLDEVTYSTPQPLPGPNAVAEAIDFTSLTWNAPGWQPMTGGGLSDTGDALVGPEAGEAEDPWLETTVTGPATLRFSWKMEAFPPAVATSGQVTLKLLMDGVESIVTAGNFADSGTPEISVPAGEHTLRFLFHSTTAQHRRPVVDDARLLLPTGDALGAPALTWSSTPPSAPWSGWLSDRYAGRSSWVESPTWRDGDATHFALNTTVTGPSRVSFDVLLPAPAPAPDGHTWQIGTETLMLEVDGVEIWRAPAAADSWQTVTALAGPGTHTIVWRAGRNFRCRLDNCIITPDPAPQPSLADVLETPGRAFFGNPQHQPADWIPVRDAASGSHDDGALAFYDSARNSSLGTMVEGPAWVTFDYRGVGLTLRVITDDGTVLTLNPDYIYSGSSPQAPVWKTSPRVFIPSGSHTFRWDTGSRLAAAPVPWVQVDTLVITPLYSEPGEVPLAEALDAPGLTFTSTGTAWSGRSVAGATGGDAAVIISAVGDSSLLTTVTGPGTLVWRWKAEFGTYWSTLSLLVDNGYKVILNAEPPGDWHTAEWPVPPGTHTVKWFLRSHYSNTVSWLDDVRLVPAPSLAEALELPAGLTVNVESGGPAPVTLRDGSDVVFLDTASGDNPVLSTTVTGPGELSFDWKHSLHPESYYKMITVDGQPAGDWTPFDFGRDYTRAAIAVGAGQHIIRWNAGFPGGGDASGLWLDHVSWSAGLPAWAQAAGGIGSNGVSAWLTGGKVPWSAAAGAGFNNSAAAKSSHGWLQAIVPSGPGSLCWWGRTADTTLGAGQLDGPGQFGFLSQAWRFVRAGRSSGQPLPIWRARSEAFVTGVNFTPAVTVPLPQALDAPAVVFETSPGAPWSGVVVDGAPLGPSAAKAGYAPDNEGGSWLSAAFTGPGQLTFAFRTLDLSSSRVPWATVVAGSQQSTLTSSIPGAWQSKSLWLEAGTHDVRWTLSIGEDGDELWLDNVKFTPSQSVSLAAALEYTGAPWTTGGTGVWEGLAPLPDTTGDDAAPSPALQTNEETWIETTVPGSGVLTWRWRHSPSSPLGQYECLLDGLPLTSIHQGSGWQTERWELPSGPHTVRWRYRAAIAGNRQALLDDVAFTPGAAPAWESALGAQTVPVGGGGASPWQITAENELVFLRNESIPGISLWPEADSALFADVTGPARVEFLVKTQTGYHLGLDDSVEWFTPIYEWTPGGIFVPAGRHRMRWKVSSFRKMDLRQLRVIPLIPIPLAEAVEAAGLTIFNEAAQPWIGVREQNRPDDDDYAVVLAPPESERTLEVEFTGPGILRAGWEMPSEYTGARLLLREGAVELQPLFIIAGDAWGTKMVKQFGPGTHRVQLAVEARQQFVETRLTRLQFEQWPEVSIGEAFGTPGRTFTTGGSGTWAGVVRPELANQGNSVVQALMEPFQTGWLETEITGPAEVSFWYRITAATFSNLLLSVDGFQQHQLSHGGNDDSAGTETFRIPAGTHTLRWQWQRNGDGVSGFLNTVLLDRLIITPLSPIPLAEAAEAPGFVFTPVAGDWTGWRSVEAHNGGDFLEVSRATGYPVSLTLPLTGPGILRWWWRDDYAGMGHEFTASLDGLQQAHANLNTGGWQPAALAVPPGGHTIAFNISASGVTGALGGLDGFTWLPTSATTTLANAAEGTGLTNISTGAPGDWFPAEDPAFAFDGRHSLVSPRYFEPLQLHRLLATAQGPGTLSFVSNSPGTEELSVSVDGSAAGAFAVEEIEGYWKRRHHFTGATGTHSLEWVIQGRTFAGNESAIIFLDNISFTPSAPVPLATALEQPAWTFRTGGPQPWAGATSSAGVHGNLAHTFLSAADPNAPENWIETGITGPGTLYSDLKSPAGTSRRYVDGMLITDDDILELTAGLHTVRWAVSHAAPAVDATVTLDNLEWLPGTWDGWVAHHFPAGTPVASMAFDADPDTDGFPNGVEAVLATSPLRPDNTPPLTFLTAPNVYPHIAYTSSISPPDGITIAIESAASPAGPWSTQCQRTTPDWWVGDCFFAATFPTETRISRYFQTAPGSARFYRLRVTKSNG